MRLCSEAVISVSHHHTAIGTDRTGRTQARTIGCEITQVLHAAITGPAKSVHTIGGVANVPYYGAAIGTHGIGITPHAARCEVTQILHAI
ncbi:hypothetical protein D3C78_792920 [compost metagenome]